MRARLLLFVAGVLAGIVTSAIVPAAGIATLAAAAPAAALPAPAAPAAGPPPSTGPTDAVAVTTVAADPPAVRLPVASRDDGCVAAPLARRASQVLVVGLPETTSADEPLARDVVELGVGGIFLADGNVVDAAQLRAFVAALRDAARLPLLVATDEETGRVSSVREIVGATSSPRTLTATRSPDEVRRFAAQLGRDLLALGIDVDLAPVADLDAGPSDGVIGDRSFSADPATATRYARAFARGLADAGVTPVVKHFPGHGRAVGDVHKGTASVTAPLSTLRHSDLVPFRALVDAGAPVVMLGHVTYGALAGNRPASVSPGAYRLLRDLGFTGVAMTDSLGMGAIHRRWDFPRAAVLAVGAGADAVLATDGRQARRMVRAIVTAVRSGELSEERLDEAAARMLQLKGVDPATLTCATVAASPTLAAR